VGRSSAVQAGHSARLEVTSGFHPPEVIPKPDPPIDGWSGWYHSPKRVPVRARSSSGHQNNPVTSGGEMNVTKYVIPFIPVRMRVSCRNEIRKGIDEFLAPAGAELSPDRNPTPAGISLRQTQPPRIDGNYQRYMALRQKLGKLLHVLHGACECRLRPPAGHNRRRHCSLGLSSRCGRVSASLVSVLRSMHESWTSPIPTVRR
jgi:hypothetical protein